MRMSNDAQMPLARPAHLLDAPDERRYLLFAASDFLNSAAI